MKMFNPGNPIFSQIFVHRKANIKDRNMNMERDQETRPTTVNVWSDLGK